MHDLYGVLSAPENINVCGTHTASGKLGPKTKQFTTQNFRNDSVGFFASKDDFCAHLNTRSIDDISILCIALLLTSWKFKISKSISANNVKLLGCVSTRNK